MTEFLIHVGPHKTGSTYIQYWLDQSFPTFLKEGIYVPTEWRDSEPNPSHTVFSRKLAGGLAQSLKLDFDQWIAAGYRKVVLSCEDLAALPFDRLCLLKDLMGDTKITVVLYVRRWSELIMSHWNESIVHGGTSTFPEFAIEILRVPESTYFVDISKLVEKFIGAFGAANVRLVSFNGVVDSRRDLFVHFCRRFLGLKDVTHPGQEKINESFSSADAEIVRLLNCRDEINGKAPSPTNAIAFRNAYHRLDLEHFRNSLEPFRRSLAFSDNEEPFDRVATANRHRYAANFVGPLPADRLYVPKVVTANYYATICGLSPNVQAHIDRLNTELFGDDAKATPIKRLFSNLSRRL